MSGNNPTPRGLPEREHADESEFELSEFLRFDEWLGEEWLGDDPAASNVSGHVQNPVYQANEGDESGGSGSHVEGSSRMGDPGGGSERREARVRVAFKTISEVEVLDDGFKWRKYGKKMVKNSPNPRNYYRCSVEGCPVKKRIERDGEDPRYVITTYEGVHNHQSSS